MSTDNFSEDEYDGMLLEIRENRKALDSMLETASTFRKKVGENVPDVTDFKKRYLMDEKMKTVATIFGLELDIRKQKESSLRTEIELRRKLTGQDQKNSLDVNEISKAIEKIEGKKLPTFGDDVPADV